MCLQRSQHYTYLSDWNLKRGLTLLLTTEAFLRWGFYPPFGLKLPTINLTQFEWGWDKPAALLSHLDTNHNQCCLISVIHWELLHSLCTDCH